MFGFSFGFFCLKREVLIKLSVVFPRKKSGILFPRKIWNLRDLTDVETSQPEKGSETDC